jgi:hypothetical protein
MKKEVLLLFLVVMFILSAGVLAQEIVEDSEDGDIQIPELSQEEIEEFVKGFVRKSNFVKDEEVKSVSIVNQSELPDDIEIKDIDENNVGIYEVNFTEEASNQSKKIFVVTYATNNFKKKNVVITKNIQSMYFGLSGSETTSEFLETSTGVKSGEQIGYVMLRGGSITGVSTSLELNGNGRLLIRVYKNGEDTGFHNLISTDGDQTIDFDLQSEDILNYNPGDVISVYVEKIGRVTWGNVVTTVETTS